MTRPYNSNGADGPGPRGDGTLTMQRKVLSDLPCGGGAQEAWQRELPYYSPRGWR